MSLSYLFHKLSFITSMEEFIILTIFSRLSQSLGWNFYFIWCILVTICCSMKYYQRLQVIGWIRKRERGLCWKFDELWCHATAAFICFVTIYFEIILQFLHVLLLSTLRQFYSFGNYLLRQYVGVGLWHG